MAAPQAPLKGENTGNCKAMHTIYNCVLYCHSDSFGVKTIAKREMWCRGHFFFGVGDAGVARTWRGRGAVFRHFYRTSRPASGAAGASHAVLAKPAAARGAANVTRRQPNSAASAALCGRAFQSRCGPQQRRRWIGASVCRACP
eukprot:gene10602-biopygen1774